LYVGGDIDVFGSANFKTIPTSINPELDNSSNQLATTSFVKTNINNLIGGAGPLLDTLKEIQTALNDDPSFNVTINNLISSNNALAVHLAGDETITGFRFSTGGAQELFGVTPDLSTFGKGLAIGEAGRHYDGAFGDLVA
jgi:hypothetical protein